MFPHAWNQELVIVSVYIYIIIMYVMTYEIVAVIMHVVRVQYRSYYAV